MPPAIVRGYVMRKLFFLVFFFFLISVSAVNIDISDNPENQNTQSPSELALLKVEVQRLSAKIDSIPTEQSFSENFAQLDASVNARLIEFTYTQIAFVIGTLVLNDILILAIYVILKSRGYL